MTSGTVHWRKGTDIFIQLVRTIYKLEPKCNIKFVWVGKSSFKENVIIQEDLRKLGLQEYVTFPGEVDNPTEYFKDFDVFVMTSREDPFPLVCIEVGQLGKPIVSFDKATGINEFLANGGGFVVPYLDIEEMALKLLFYKIHLDFQTKKISLAFVNISM